MTGNGRGYVDSHAHLYFDRFDGDRADTVARARAAGFTQILNIGIDIQTTRQALALAAEFPGCCYASAGLHPTEAALDAAALARVVAELEEIIAAYPREVRAVGETGLDYYWKRSTPAEQERAFRAQIELALRTSLPIVIHCRDAMGEALAVVADYAPRARGVFHCFSGSAEQARAALALGWHVSFAGNVTYPKATELHSAARAVPPERLLLETDAPFLAPQAHRGRRNEPAFALDTAGFLATIHGVTTEEIAATMAENARALFAFA